MQLLSLYICRFGSANRSILWTSLIVDCFLEMVMFVVMKYDQLKRKEKADS